MLNGSEFQSEVNSSKQRTVADGVQKEGVRDESKEGHIEHVLKDAKELVSSDLGFWHAFVASFAVIIVSELGDKTWFIAAIMAMRHSRLTVFLGAMAALVLMTFLSGLFVSILFLLLFCGFK